MSDVPGFKLDGHAFSPFNLYRSGGIPLNLRDNLDRLPARDDPVYPEMKNHPLGA